MHILSVSKKNQVAYLYMYFAPGYEKIKVWPLPHPPHLQADVVQKHWAWEMEPKGGSR